ncbi:WD40/YVTN/BNR-like repeat-containing protein [Enhygromyxa salina]|uniref:BNR/Asp-box repeat protein n=1 Tax=Enhygromyxa salina TaxID=215803 RepID=A0A2S9XTG7_9BACT|nr:hypothetical protein [Enhygromyxa salina]PRP96159.1 hypothetical protein ENSA7_69730 [Enhygromyxa salina]
MTDRRRALILLGVTATIACLTGCRETSSNVHVTPAQPQPGAVPERPAVVARTGAPACEASVGPGREVLVAGRSTGLIAEFDDEVRLRSYPWSDDQILLAVGRAHPWRNWIHSDEQHTLWQIPCDNPSAKVVALHVDGAEFSWAAPTPDGRGLYFSYSPGSVQFFDYATNTWGPVVEPAQISECWMAEAPVTADDYITGWAGVGQLAVVTGGPCGFEAEWLGGAEVIELPSAGAAGAAQRRPAVHVSSIAADPSGRLWVSSGGLCTKAQTMKSRGAAGVWRSTDDGARWDLVEIPELDGAGVDAVWAAASAPERLLLRSECCYVEAADFCSGGKLLRSEDGGASWARVSPGVNGSPPGDPHFYGPVEALRVGPELLELDALVNTVEGALRVRSIDGGQRWAPLDPNHAIAPTPAARQLELGGWTFTIEPDGLARRRLSEPAELVLRPRVINLGR